MSVSLAEIGRCIHKCTSAFALAIHPTNRASFPGSTRDLEGLFPVDIDHGDPDPVLELELVVALDVDLVELESDPRPLRQDRFASHVAEMTPRAGVQDDRGGAWGAVAWGDGSVRRQER